MRKRKAKTKIKFNDPTGDMGHRDVTKPCELCPNPRVQGERYCPRHRAAMLRKMEADNYFVEVDEQTATKFERQDRQHERETVRDALEDMMDRLDSYRDRQNDNVPLAESV